MPRIYYDEITMLPIRLQNKTPTDVYLWEEEKNTEAYLNIIRGPNHKPAFILPAGNNNFPVKHPKTGEKVWLEHTKAQTAIGIDDQLFATASLKTVRIWNFNDLSLKNEYKIFNIDPQYYCTLSTGDIRSLELLPNQRHLLGFTSSNNEHNHRCLWTMNVDNGDTLHFDVSKIVTDNVYKIVRIPNRDNTFAIYDSVCGHDFFIFYLDIQNKQLHLIAQHKNLKLGSFYDIKISPDGKYWAIEKRYFGNPGSGIEVYRIDENYNMECIAKMFEAMRPQWNNNNSLFYIYKDKVCELQLENLSHQILATADEKSYSHHLQTFCISENSFQVIDSIQSTVKTYETNNGDITTSIQDAIPLPKELTQYITKQYAAIEKKPAVPLYNFKDTLFKAPADDTYSELKTIDASKNKIPIQPIADSLVPIFTLSFPYN